MNSEKRGNPFCKEGMTEVRCCCDPGKLLGFLPYNGPMPDWPKRSQTVRFSNKDGSTTEEELHCLTLLFTYGYAFKSNDKGMDHFRNIEGFVEAGQLAGRVK